MNKEVINPDPAPYRWTAVEKDNLVPAAIIVTVVVGIFFLPGIALGLFAIIYSFKAREAYGYGYLQEGEHNHVVARRFVAYQIGITIIVYLAAITFVIFYETLRAQRPGAVCVP